MEFEIRLVRWSALRIQKIEVVPTPIPYPSIPFFRFVVRTEGQQFFVHSFRRAKKKISLYDCSFSDQNNYLLHYPIFPLSCELVWPINIFFRSKSAPMSQ